MCKTKFHHTSETTIGDTVVTIESCCPYDSTDDILDALIRLMKRNVAGVAADEE